MRTFIEFNEDCKVKEFIDAYKAQLDDPGSLQRVQESDAVANTTDGVAAVDAQLFKTGTIAGCNYVEVDFDTYNKCKFGKKHYARWDKYIADEELRGFIRSEFAKTKSLMIVNRETTAATYLRR